MSASNENTHIYGVFTRKQANALFAVHKSGDIFMTRKQINAMYGIIGYQWCDMTEEQRKFRTQLQDAFDFIISGSFDMAQSRINGKNIDGGIEYMEDFDRFPEWNEEPEFISIEPKFNGYRIVC